MTVRLVAAGFAALVALTGASRAQELNLAVGAPVTSLDPHYHALSPNYAVADMLFDSLTTFDAKGRLQPRLAESWKPVVLSEDLHVVHNLWPYTPAGWKKPMSLLAASYEGYTAVMLGADGRPPQTKVVHPGNQRNPKGSRGASEIKSGHFAKPDPAGRDRAAGAFVATIEPWHGNEVVVYTGPGGGQEPRRTVLDDKLRWGHAVWCADLDGDGADELIVGVRDDPNPKAGDTFTDRRGVRVYKCTDGKGERWDRVLVDEGGVAVEDLTVADLNADGRPDLIACGRQTKNVRIYWNQGK